MNATTKTTEELIAEARAIRAQTDLLRAKAEAARQANPSLVDRPWFPWAAVLTGVFVGMGSAALTSWLK